MDALGCSPPRTAALTTASASAASPLTRQKHLRGTRARGPHRGARAAACLLLQPRSERAAERMPQPCRCCRATSGCGRPGEPAPRRVAARGAGARRAARSAGTVGQTDAGAPTSRASKNMAANKRHCGWRCSPPESRAMNAGRGAVALEQRVQRFHVRRHVTARYLLPRLPDRHRVARGHRLRGALRPDQAHGRLKGQAASVATACAVRPAPNARLTRTMGGVCGGLLRRPVTRRGPTRAWLTLWSWLLSRPSLLAIPPKTHARGLRRSNALVFTPRCFTQAERAPRPQDVGAARARRRRAAAHLVQAVIEGGQAPVPRAAAHGRRARRRRLERGQRAVARLSRGSAGRR